MVYSKETMGGLKARPGVEYTPTAPLAKSASNPVAVMWAEINPAKVQSATAVQAGPYVQCRFSMYAV